MTLITRPTITNDSGNGQDGTLIDETFLDDILDEIDDQCHSTTNTTIKPKAITDEVVTARGDLASLNARISVSLNSDGSLKEQASLVTAAQVRNAAGHVNIAKNPGLLAWSSGNAAAPDHFTLSGSGAAIARCGSGESDTTQLETGKWCAKITYGSAEAKLTQTVVASVANLAALRGKYVCVLTRCKASVANQASLVVDDGVTTTRGGATGNASYHAGDGAESVIYAIHEISGSATKLEFYYSVAASGAPYFGAPTVLISDQVLYPSDWVPSRDAAGQITFDAPHKFLMGDSAGAAVMSGRFHTTTAQGSNVGTGIDTLASVTLPANTLSENGKVVRVTAWGTFAANANTKNVSIYLGASLVYTSGAVAWNNGEWFLTAYIARHDSAAAQKTGGVLVVTPTPFAVPDQTSTTEDLTTDLLLKVTGEATNNADIVLNGFVVESIG